MQQAKTDDESPDDEDVWDRLTDVLEPLAEAVDPDPPERDENRGTKPSSA